MTNEEFKKICMSQFDHCYEIMTSRARQYGRSDDRLAQFKHVAKIRDVTPEEALMGMRAKHESSIEFMIWDLAKGNMAPLSQWQEKITDSINYLLLLKALICERMPVATAPKKMWDEATRTFVDATPPPDVWEKVLTSKSGSIQSEPPTIIEQMKECECNPNLTTHNKVEPPEAWKRLPRAMESNDGD